ncbi:MAG: hypothetical protein A3F90_04655 [Deltaproteobacteria bacterium RIFCSPLOWO2_12_FULL_60_19]|nr:MAG: hypothetical protein A3F90_04655 [Deltaproteobacteria bacterium RIFCSPLOWO2_12_FULL_60_19]
MFFRKRWIGPFVTLATIAAIELSARTVFKVPNPLILIVLAVVYSAFSGGLFGGRVSAAIAVLYGFYFFAGPGLLFHYTSENLQEKIFEKFHQVDSSEDAALRGRGLGPLHRQTIHGPARRGDFTGERARQGDDAYGYAAGVIGDWLLFCPAKSCLFPWPRDARYRGVIHHARVTFPSFPALPQ